eukprot:TRINITY_DN8542_c1_g1_i1.p1 TRINITY_DN8542_c1_g1~~TRINITY_DN8542_c1_g1_i1.p1  ORF type:complete len:554 (-),score=65.38 TRINITY_DN8542_c1_g1_i1:173-1834(-)
MEDLSSTYAPLYVAVSVVIAGMHLQLYHECVLNVWSLLKYPNSADHISETKVKDEVDKIRVSCSFCATKVLAPLNSSFLFCISNAPMLFSSFSYPPPTLFCLSLGLFLCSSPFALGIMDVTARRLDIAIVGAHALIMLRVILMDPSIDLFVINTGVRTVNKLVLGFFALNREATLVSNLLSSAVIMLKFGTATRTCLKGNSELFQFMLAELVTCLFICIASSIFENIIKDRVIALCEEEDANTGLQKTLQANRKMLTVLCDADVELDKEGKVIGECPKLAHILTVGTSKADGLAGRGFHDFILAEDREVFHDFIAWKPTQDAAQAPNSLHLVLQGAASSKFQVELFHVPINGLRRCNSECHHLIGIRELESWEPAVQHITESYGATSTSSHLQVHPPRTVHGESSASSASSQWTSISQRRPNGSEEGRQTNFGSEHAELSWASRLESLEVEVNAGHPDLPVKSVKFSFSEQMPAYSMRTLLQNDSFCALYAWLVVSVMALKCNGKPQPSLTNFALNSEQFGDVVAGQVVLQCEAQDAGETWTKFKCGDMVQCG